MARINGHSPGPPREETMRPPRLPWVLLCHESGGSCGFVRTVNRDADWADAVRDRQAHETLCAVSPKPSLILL